MPFLPIVERELRVGARRHQTYIGRLVIASAAIVVGFFIFLANRQAAPADLAWRIFLGLSILALGYCLLAGRRLTADCLSEEKREGTLGLLFLTDLRGYDVALGKLTATSVSAFYALMAIVPVLAVPLLIGGVTNGEFWRIVLVLVNTFLFSLAVGLAASAMSRDARRAYGINFLLHLLVLFPAAIAVSLLYFGWTPGLVQALCFSCPVYSFVLAFDAMYRWHIGHFWCSVGIIHLLAWALAAWASWKVPRSWQDLAVAAYQETTDWRGRWRRMLYGSAAQRQRHRRRLLKVNAFYWLAARARLKPLSVWLFLLFIAGWWLFMVFLFGFNWLDELLFGATVVMLNSILKLWIAVETPQRLAEDQKLGALELLLSTPLNEGKIIKGQWLALRRQFLLPILAVTVLEIVLMRKALSEGVRTSVGAVGTAALILLAADSAAAFWLGIASALTAKSLNHAVVRTVWRVLMLPWILFAAVAVLVSVYSAANNSEAPGWKFFLNLWLWLGLLVDLGFGLPCWWRVQFGFRDLALQRLDVSSASRH